MATAGDEGRTKIKAILRKNAELALPMLKQDPSALADKIDDLAKASVAAHTHHPRVDRRFPNTNQTNNCWTAFNEYQLCVDKRGRGDALCLQRGRDYSTICPLKFVEEWKDYITAGTSMSVGKAIYGSE